MTLFSPPLSSLPAARLLASPADHAAWNQFVGLLPEGDVLQAWEWGAVKSPGWNPLRVAVFRGESIIAGAALLVRKLPLVGNFFYAPRGPLMRDWADTDTFRLLLGAIREQAIFHKAAFLKIDPAVPAERADVSALLAAHGFAPPLDADPQGFGGTQPRCVMQLDVAGRSEAELLASFKPQTRRNIKLSVEKHGVQVLEDLTRADLATFNDLMQITGARDGFRPRPLSYFQTLWDTLVPANMAKPFLTRYQGEYLSGALCFRIGDKAWYVYGASGNEHRNTMPNYAMQWAMIRWARAQNCAWYDFRGVSPRRRQEGESAADVEADDHLQGLNRFKEGFSPRYVEYVGEYDLVYSKAAYWAYTTGKPAAQKLVRRLKGK